MSSRLYELELIYHLYVLLVLIGGINWGLVAIDPKYNIVENIKNETVKRVIYALIGVSALILIGTRIYHGTLYPKDVYYENCDDRLSTDRP